MSDMVTVGTSEYRWVVLCWYDLKEIDMYEAVRLLFNAGYRGRALDLKYRK